MTAQTERLAKLALVPHDEAILQTYLDEVDGDINAAAANLWEEKVMAFDVEPPTSDEAAASGVARVTSETVGGMSRTYSYGGDSGGSRDDAYTRAATLGALQGRVRYFRSRSRVRTVRVQGMTSDDRLARIYWWRNGVVGVTDEPDYGSVIQVQG